MPRFSSWDENLASHAPDVQAAARALDVLIREELPDVVVQYDPGNGLLAFGRSMRMRDLLFALIPHAGWVNLQLATGALLPNRDGLIEGTGKKIRHIRSDRRRPPLTPAYGRQSGVSWGASPTRGRRRQFGRAESGLDSLLRRWR